MREICSNVGLIPCDVCREFVARRGIIWSSACVACHCHAVQCVDLCGSVSNKRLTL